MKKIIALTVLMLLFAGSAFAAGNAMTTGSTVAVAGSAIYGGDTPTAAGDAKNPMVKLSSGVTGFANFDSTGYSIFTKHQKGTKIFGTPHDSTRMYYKQVTVATVLSGTSCGSSSGEANFSSGWTSY
jgi:hypothetical protein